MHEALVMMPAMKICLLPIVGEAGRTRIGGEESEERYGSSPFGTHETAAFAGKPLRKLLQFTGSLTMMLDLQHGRAALETASDVVLQQPDGSLF